MKGFMRRTLTQQFFILTVTAHPPIEARSSHQGYVAATSEGMFYEWLLGGFFRSRDALVFVMFDFFGLTAVFLTLVNRCRGFTCCSGTSTATGHANAGFRRPSGKCLRCYSAVFILTVTAHPPIEARSSHQGCVAATSEGMLYEWLLGGSFRSRDALVFVIFSLVSIDFPFFICFTCLDTTIIFIAHRLARVT